MLKVGLSRSPTVNPLERRTHRVGHARLGSAYGTTAWASKMTNAGSSMPSQTQPATVYLAQAKQLIADIAAAVAPHATLRTPVGDRGPLPCTDPLKGLQYYSTDREFDAPAGQTGASLIPAIAEQLKKHGYQTVQDEVAGKAEVRASTATVGISVTGVHDGTTIHFAIDTQCGTAGNG